MTVRRKDIKEALQERGNTSSENATSAASLAHAIGYAADDKDYGHVSIALSDMAREGSHGIHRDKRDGKYRYWLGRKTKPVGKRPSRRKTADKANGASKTVGLYFTQASGEDILLTFDEARCLYKQMEVIFG